VAGEERALALAGKETEVLALGLARDREPGPGRDLAHLGLRQLGEREAHQCERFRRERGEHVGLILGRVGGAGKQRPVAVVGDARVVAGREA
jgi:hypothetical protein